MPLDSTFSDPIETGTVIDAKDINDKFKKLEDFVNGGIDRSDIKYFYASEADAAGVTF